MQSWSIKIDIKLNIDDLNWSVDGQIIDLVKSENVFSHVMNSSQRREGWMSKYFTYN